MPHRLLTLATAMVFLGGCLFASSAAAQVSTCAAERQTQIAQENKDMPVVLQVLAEINVRGLPALNAHVDDLTLVLSHAPAAEIAPCDGTLYRRLAGVRASTAETAQAVAAIQARDPGAKVVVLGLSPYPLASGLVGTAYVERGAWDKADKAMQPGLRLNPLDVRLVNEESLALSHLGRAAEAIVLCDRFLAAATGLTPAIHARILRTRGFALGEAGRCDDAIASYEDSLRIEPDNGLAKNEISYLLKRKSGAPAQAPVILDSGKGAAVKPQR